jgi:hypothetical protein
MRLMNRGGVLERVGTLASCLAFAVLIGCGHSSQLAGVSASGSRTSATPTLSLTPPPATLPTSSTATASVFGRCRLPVIVPHSRTQADPWAGWLDVPAGTYSPDPSSNLAGATTLAWDAGVGKWIPTEPSYMSPDGLDYVAQNAGPSVATAARVPPGIEIVDARTGDIVQRVSTGPANHVVGYTRSAVYLISNGMLPQPGLWRIDTASGQLTQVSSAKGDWEVADDTAAWGTSTTPDNIVTVKRLDLSTGVVTDVYKPAAGSIASVAGFAGSGVLVTISSPGSNRGLSVVVIHQDGSVVAVDVPAAMHYGGLGNAVQDGPALIFWAAWSTAWPPLPDNHQSGLAAYDPDHGLQLLMTDTPPDIFLLGRCMSS